MTLNYHVSNYLIKHKTGNLSPINYVFFPFLEMSQIVTGNSIHHTKNDFKHIVAKIKSFNHAKIMLNINSE